MPSVPHAKKLSILQYNDNTGAALNAFQNSLFDPWPGPFASPPPRNLFRAQVLQEIKAHEFNGQPVVPAVWLVDTATVTLLVQILRGYWHKSLRGGGGIAPRTLARDEAMIQLISAFIMKHKLCMAIPRFTCATKRDAEPSSYQLMGYETHAFLDDGDWNGEAVDIFLTHFLAGAHFVVVQSSVDLGTGLSENFFAKFKQLNGAKKAGHSHYTGHKVSLNGQNYPTMTLTTVEGPQLDEITIAADATLLPVVLCDETANTSPNAFFQMEGWPPGKSMLGVSKPEYRNPALAGGYRHGADFNTHGKSIWNISTYAASLFSEKRGGAIFLAPESWLGGPLRGYQGFGGGVNQWVNHSWFQPKLISAPKL